MLVDQISIKFFISRLPNGADTINRPHVAVIFRGRGIETAVPVYKDNEALMLLNTFQQNIKRISVKNMILEFVLSLVRFLLSIYDLISLPIYYAVCKPWENSVGKKKRQARMEIKSDCIIYSSLKGKIGRGIFHYKKDINTAVISRPDSQERRNNCQWPYHDPPSSGSRVSQASGSSLPRNARSSC